MLYLINLSKKKEIFGTVLENLLLNIAVREPLIKCI